MKKAIKKVAALILMAGQVSLITRFWDLFRRKEPTVS